jgi:hypothetical protein
MKIMQILDLIGIKHNCDKNSKHHDYLKVYEKYFEPVKNDNIVLVELGYGGYEYPDRGGAGAKTWLEYFTQAGIISVDLHKKTNIPTDNRFIFYQGSQDDEDLLSSIVTTYLPNIVIDDASHINSLTIKTFEIIFPLLKSGSLYVVEDCHTSYWEQNYGGSLSPVAVTSMNYFKRLTDFINYETNGFGDMGIEWIHFYKQLIFIKKK